MELLLEMPSDFDRELAIAARPDDLEYGASAADRFGGRLTTAFQLVGA